MLDTVSDYLSMRKYRNASSRNQIFLTEGIRLHVKKPQGPKVIPQVSGTSTVTVTVTASWVVAGIDRVTILSLYQSAVYNETKYRRLRLSCCNKLLTISQLPSSS